MADQNDSLAAFKTELRSVLTCEKDGIPLQYVNKEYKELIGYDIKFRDHNFRSLEDFLLSLKDVCYLERSDYETIVKPVLTDKQVHIGELVGGQKNKFAKKNNKFIRPRGGFTSRFNKFSISGRKSYSRSLLHNGNSFDRPFRTDRRSPELGRRSPELSRRSPELSRRSREICVNDEERRERRRRRFSNDFKSRSDSPTFNDNFKRRDRSSDRRRSQSRERSSRRNRSPIRENRSPRRENRSPRRENRSPRRENRSPRRENRSPRRNNRSPRRNNRSPRRDNKSPRRENRSRIRSKSRERSIKKDDYRNTSVHKSVDNLNNNNNKIKDSPIQSTRKRKRSPIKENVFVNRMKDYLQSCNLNENNSQQIDKVNDTFIPPKIVSYDIRAKNVKDDSFKIKIIDKSANDSHNKTYSNNNNSNSISNNHNNDSKLNDITFDDDHMDVCSQSSSTSKIIESNENKSTEEIQKQEVRDPRLMKRAERINLNNNLVENKSDLNAQEDDDDDEDVKKLLYDTKFSKIRDYSPERYKKKMTHIIEEQNNNNDNYDNDNNSKYNSDDEEKIFINSKFEYADSSSTKFNYDDLGMKLPASDLFNCENLPSISIQSLRSFTRFSEADSSTVDTASLGINMSPDFVLTDDEEDNESNESKNENTHPIDFSKHSIEFEDNPELSESNKLIRSVSLKLLSAIPGPFTELFSPQPNLISASSKNDLSKNELSEIIRLGGLDKVNLDQKVNYKIELKKFIKEHRLPNPIYETFFCGEGNLVNSYVSSLAIGDKKWYCILRLCNTNDDVENCVAKKALDELNEIINKDNNSNNSTDSNNSNSMESDFISKIIKLFNNNKDMIIFSNVLETRFKNVYTEDMIPNWREIIETSKCLELKKNIVNDNICYSVALKDNLMDNN